MYPKKWGKNKEKKEEKKGVETRALNQVGYPPPSSSKVHRVRVVDIPQL